MLDGHRGEGDIWKGIEDKTRSLVRRAEAACEVVPDTVDELVLMARSTFERQGRRLPYDPTVLERAARTALDRGAATVLTTRLAEDPPAASVLVVHDTDRSYYLVGGADPAHRKIGAGALLIWRGIQESLARGNSFDFEGSMLDGVERHFRTYGGTREIYIQVTGGPRAVRAGIGVAEALRAK